MCTEAGLSTAKADHATSSDDNVDEEEVGDDLKSVLQITAAGHLAAAGGRTQQIRVQQRMSDNPSISTTSHDSCTCTRLFRKLGIQPDGGQNIVCVQHVEEAAGMSIEGTLKDRLRECGSRLGVVRVSGPEIANGLATSLVNPQLAKLQMQMDRVLGLLTGQSHREEMQQMVKAVGVHERMAERRRPHHS